MTYPPPCCDEIRVRFSANAVFGAGAPIVMFDFSPPDVTVSFSDRYRETVDASSSLFDRERPLVPSFCPMQTIDIPIETTCTIAFPRHAVDAVPEYDRVYPIAHGYRYAYGYFRPPMPHANTRRRVPVAHRAPRSERARRSPASKCDKTSAARKDRSDRCVDPAAPST